METILTMELQGNFITFIIERNGTAKETKTGEIIPDFASTFELLSTVGSRTVAETNVVKSERKSNIIPFVNNGKETFREQWDEYLTEYSDNLEIAYAM